MEREKVEIGKEFGRLKVVERLGRIRKHKNVYWKCECSCGSGKEVIVSTIDLSRGHTKSCGCYRKEITRNKSLKHGFSVNRTHDLFYKMWSQMKQRCDNSNNPDYHHYGGRGISHDPRWNDFLEFKKDMYFNYLVCKRTLKMEKPSLERIDVNGNYCKENCTFIEKRDQSKNQRQHKKFVGIDPDGNRFYGTNKADFAREHDLSSAMIRGCLNGKYCSHDGWYFGYIGRKSRRFRRIKKLNLVKKNDN